ncbi:MAG: hypothetical protein NW208_19170, partial [Bryobacter sp.]|nr:hypothetical protein [Bryobacter sp.]
GDKKRLATLHYYATHPMSLYGQGHVSGDFVGDAREALPGFHVYFTGAAGNIGAGKYNDGAPTRRAELAAKLRRAMESAIEHEERTRTLDLRWKSAPVLLPQRSGPEHQTAALEKKLNDASTLPRDRASAARFLAWQAACQARQPISLSALAWEGGQVVHMPGELFVEYQLAAQAEAPGQSIAMAAYGDYGPMYIGTAKSYAEGGYETSWVSRVDPSVEEILKNAVRGLLKG